MNIGYACALLEKQMEVMVVSASNAKDTVLQLQAAKFTIEQQNLYDPSFRIIGIVPTSSHDFLRVCPPTPS